MSDYHLYWSYHFTLFLNDISFTIINDIFYILDIYLFQSITHISFSFPGVSVCHQGGAWLAQRDTAQIPQGVMLEGQFINQAKVSPMLMDAILVHV